MTFIQVMTFLSGPRRPGRQSSQTKALVAFWKTHLSVSLLKVERGKKSPFTEVVMQWVICSTRRWASFPLCAAVIWLITSICSSRGAASSSLSAGWALSVSSRAVGSEGKQRPSALSGGILSVPYPCWVAGPEIKLSETPGPQKPRLGRLVILELSPGVLVLPTVTVAHFTPAMSPYPLGPVAAGGQDKEDAKHIPLCCSQPSEPPQRSGMEQPSAFKGNRWSFKSVFSSSLHLMSSCEGFGGWRVTGPTPKHLDQGWGQGHTWGFFQHFQNAAVSSELLNRSQGFHSC